MATRKPPRMGFATPRVAAPKPARMDAKGVLESLEKLRAALPKVEEDEVPSKPRKRVMDEGRFDARSIEDFEMQVVMEAMETLAEDVGRVAEAKRKKLIDHLLKVYYVTEEAVLEPGQEHLNEYLEKMRQAWQQDYGRPIPTRAESEARGLVIPPLHPPVEAGPDGGMPGDPPAFQDPLDTKPDPK